MAIVDKFLKSAQCPGTNIWSWWQLWQWKNRQARQAEKRQVLRTMIIWDIVVMVESQRQLLISWAAHHATIFPCPNRSGSTIHNKYDFPVPPAHRRQDHKYNTEIQKYRTIQSRKYDIPVAWGRRGDNHKHIRAFPLTVSAWLASIVSSPRRKLRCFWETEFL